MYSKIISFLLYSSLILFYSKSAFADKSNYKVWLNYEAQKSLPNLPYETNILNNLFGLQAIKNFGNITTNLTLSSDKKRNLMFDQSFIEVKNNNKLFGIGKINRNWSFSPVTSLILSKNARQSESIYFYWENYENRKNILTSLTGPISFEAFNTFPSKSKDINNSMLLGVRATIEPIENLKFEIAKTSQWGGDGSQNNLSTFSNAIIGNSNEGENSNINQMAGFGISFETKTMGIPLKIYSQLIGEDEAGNLPSCYIGLIGGELKLPKSALFSRIGFEFLDTRTDTSEEGNCGPNTAYNNGYHAYTNYGKTLGTSIDTEGKSFNLWVSGNISKKVSTKFSIADVTINDSNWSEHRLNSKKENGLQVNNITTLKIENFKIKTMFNYQGFSLNKANLKKGLNINLSTEYSF
jgi:hypothetical protein